MENADKKIAIVYGTRPEIIKLAPIIRELQAKSLPFFCVHTGQHYSFEMDEVFFRELSLPIPKYKIDVGSKSIAGHGAQVGVMLAEIEKIFLEEKPDAVIVQGDTNSVLAGALVATKIPVVETGKHIRIAHVEAGLRSYDRLMPEEVNRVVVDHISDYLFAPTEKEKDILIKEGLSEDSVFVVGNTVVDMMMQTIKIAEEESGILDSINLERNGYILLTLHRQENVDSKDVLKNILLGIEKVSEKVKLPVIYPIHPRTQKMLNTFNMILPKNIRTIKPVGYLDFIMLEKNAKLIMTDSGGLQEEACILKVPCVTLRTTTERPETVNIGANIVAGIDSDSILEGAELMIRKDTNWENPFGDGKTAKKIVEILTK